jgi:hypothetical protein
MRISGRAFKAPKVAAIGGVAEDAALVPATNYNRLDLSHRSQNGARTTALTCGLSERGRSGLIDDFVHSGDKSSSSRGLPVPGKGTKNCCMAESKTTAKEKSALRRIKNICGSDTMRGKPGPKKLNPE